MRKLSKKSIAIAAVTFVLLGGGVGGAIAYWTASGSGTGTAGTASSSAAVNVTQTGSITNLAPGSGAQNITGVYDNLNAAPTYVATVTISISSVTGGAGSCAASDYTLTNAVLTVGAVVDDGDAVGTDADGDATIEFNNKVTNQDGCKGATVHLAFTVA